MEYPAGRKYRLTRRQDIARLFEQGIKASDRLLTLYALPNSLEQSRAGVGVSKRHGNAVRRNYIKRLCREAFRLTRPTLPGGWDFFLVPRAGAELTLESLQQSIPRLAGRLTSRRIGAKPPQERPGAE